MPAAGIVGTDFACTSPDDALAGQPGTEKAIKKYYGAVSRSRHVKPFPWLSVVRHFNALLKLIYGPTLQARRAVVFGSGACTESPC